MKGLGKRLQSGLMLLAPDRQVIEIRSRNGDIIDTIAYGELAGSDWGYVYERYVAQHLEAKGFEIDMWGLSKGFTDKGIDIVACKDGQHVFIQCKHTTVSKISKERTEWILYKASAVLNAVYDGRKLLFWLVVPSLVSAFTKCKSNTGKDEYPIANYFLSKNSAQSKVKLEIHEIGMQR